MPDQIYSVNWNGKEKVKYTYDDLGRLEDKTFNGVDTFKTKYTYENVGEKETTTLVKSVTTPTGTLTYEYDKLGNITSISDGTYTTTYEYDSLNQLTRVNDEKAGNTTTYSYTNGNITECNEYDYTVGVDALIDPKATKTWNYNDSTWSDLLTDFNGESITYDEIGNPLTIGNKSLTWLGRQLQSVTDGENTYSYAYNGDGLRTSKTVNGTTTEYFYNGSILAGQKTGDDTLVFMYDNNSDIFGFIYEDTEYYYIKNAQNDVIAIADANGNVLVKYEYDAWGKVTLITDGHGIDINDLKADKFDPTTGEIIPEVDENGNVIETIPPTVRLARINPILYRSYYYDAETEWYYLSTRYYSPDMCRFISADGYVQTGQGMLDKNMFAYCENNPINRLDDNGDSWKSIKNKIIRKYSALSRFINNLFPTAQTAKSGGAEHKNRGTKGHHNKGKHEKGQARKGRDAGGEKGDKRRKPNPNKRKFSKNNEILKKTIYSVAIVAVITVTFYIAANDATIIGVLDDAFIAPLSAILWELSNKVIA